MNRQQTTKPEISKDFNIAILHINKTDTTLIKPDFHSEHLCDCFLLKCALSSRTNLSDTAARMWTLLHG